MSFVGLLQNWNMLCKYRQLESAGAGVGNYNTTLCLPPGGHRWIVLNAYAYHDDGAANHNIAWTWRDETETPASYLVWGETLRAANEPHCLHSFDGDPADPSMWLGQPPICEDVRVLTARGHGIPADKKLYVEILVLEGRLDE